MALVLSQTRQLPTQQLKGYTDVLNRVITSTKDEQEAGYQSVVRKEDASIRNIKPIGLSLKRETDPEAPNAGNMRISVSDRAENIGIGSSLRMSNTKEDFFQKLDGDMYKYRLVPNGEMVDAWHENKGDRFGRDKDTTKRIFTERQTNQFSDITGEDKYMEEDTYEPVTARPAMGLPPSTPPPTDTSARREGEETGLTSRFSRFLDSVLSGPSTPTTSRRTAAPYTDPVPRQSRQASEIASRRQTATPAVRRQVATEAARQRPSRAQIEATLTPVVQERRNWINSMPPATPARAPPNTPATASTSSRQRATDMLTSLDRQLQRIEQIGRKEMNTPRKRSGGTTETKSQESEDILRQRQQRSPPTKTPKKVLFQTPETGGGGGETGGAADQTPGRMLSVSRAITTIGKISDPEQLKTLEKAIRSKDRKLIESLKGVGPSTASAFISDDPYEKKLILESIADRRRTMPPPLSSESGGAAPNKDELIDEILSRGLTHHNTGKPLTRQELNLKSLSSLQRILSKK